MVGTITGSGRVYQNRGGELKFSTILGLRNRWTRYLVYEIHPFHAYIGGA